MTDGLATGVLSGLLTLMLLTALSAAPAWAYPATSALLLLIAAAVVTMKVARQLRRAPRC